MAIISQLLAQSYGDTELMLNYNDSNLTAQAFILSCDKNSPFDMKWWVTLAGQNFSGIVRHGTMANQFPIASYGIKGEWRINRFGDRYLFWPFTVVGISTVAPTVATG